MQARNVVSIFAKPNICVEVCGGLEDIIQPKPNMMRPIAL